MACIGYRRYTVSSLGVMAPLRTFFRCDTFHVGATDALYTISLMVLRCSSGFGEVTAVMLNIHLHLFKIK